MNLNKRGAGTVGLVVISTLLAACGSSNASSTGVDGSAGTSAHSPIKVGMIQEARPQVEPWSAAWHDAMKEVEKQDSSISDVETYNAYDATRAEPVIRQMLDSGAKVMLMTTFVLADIAKSVAKDYPKTPMVVSAFGATQAPNLNSLTASYLETGYSTCWLLTKLSPDGRIGLVDAQGAPFETEIEQGCALGAKAANPAATQVKVSTNSFTDTQVNREQTQSLLNKGIKQLYFVSGTEDAVGGLRLCEEVNAQCATWGGDAAQWAPKSTVLTVNLNWSVVINNLIDQARTGLKPVQVYDLTYGSKGLRALDYSSNPAVSSQLKTEFEKVIADLASLKIKLPTSKAHPGYR